METRVRVFVRAVAPISCHPDGASCAAGVRRRRRPSPLRRLGLRHPRHGRRDGRAAGAAHERAQVRGEPSDAPRGSTGRCSRRAMTTASSKSGTRASARAAARSRPSSISCPTSVTSRARRLPTEARTTPPVPPRSTERRRGGSLVATSGDGTIAHLSLRAWKALGQATRWTTSSSRARVEAREEGARGVADGRPEHLRLRRLGGHLGPVPGYLSSIDRW